MPDPSSVSVGGSIPSLVISLHYERFSFTKFRWYRNDVASRRRPMNIYGVLRTWLVEV